MENNLLRGTHEIFNISFPQPSTSGPTTISLLILILTIIFLIIMAFIFLKKATNMLFELPITPT